MVLTCHHAPPGLEQECVYAGVVGAVGEGAVGEGGVEFGVELEAPGVGLVPGECTVLDGEELVAMLRIDADGDAGFAEKGDAGEEEAEEVHDVLPLDVALVAEVGGEFFELAHDVAVVGLIGEAREEGAAHSEHFLGQGRGLFDDGGPKAFEHVGVGLEGEDEEFLQLPVALLGLFVLELLGQAIEGPVEFGGREVDAAAVGVGVGMLETVGAGTDDALEDDVLLEVVLGEGGILLGHAAVLEVAEGHEFDAFEGGFEAVGETNAVGVLVVDGGGGDDADDAGGMERAAVGTADFGAADDLGADGEDEGEVVVHGVTITRVAGCRA